MKIVQLIDSLNPGGAERMAVAYANALAERGHIPYLWTSREEGTFKETISPQVNYRFLNRKGKIGLKALLKTRKLLQQEGIEIIHAHGTSYFFGVLLKLAYPRVKLVWHDHYGNRNSTQARSNKTLIICSICFDLVIVVNQSLKNWYNKYLKTKNIHYLPNFVSSEVGVLQSNKNATKTIICVANLREPKNHGNLIKAFKIINNNNKSWNLKLVGKDNNDTYSQDIKSLISEMKLDDFVSILGERENIFELLKTADIGVLSSDSEGLPISLLEYGLARLPVVCTDAGYCREVVREFGKIVPVDNPDELAKALLQYIENPDRGLHDAAEFHNHIKQNYTDDAVMPVVIRYYQDIIRE